MLTAPRAAARALRAAPDPLALPADCLAPHYNGQSVANLGPTLAALFGVPFDSPLPPWSGEVLGGLGEGVERVLLFVLDAVGWAHMVAALDDARLPTLARWLTRGARLRPLTSTFPSTTVAATTSLWSGTAPAQHGLLGLTLFLREPGMLVNLLAERPAIAGGAATGSLAAWGLPLRSLVGTETSARQLAQHGIDSRAFLDQALTDSPLSTVQFESARLSGIRSPLDLSIAAAGALAKRARNGRRSIVSGYWDSVDRLSHAYGPTDPRWPLEVESLLWTIDQGIATLEPTARRGALLLLMADHGHARVDPAQAIRLTDHPALRALLDQRPGGDGRAAYLHTRHPAAVRAYLRQHLPDAFHLFDVAEMLRAGLWGPPPHHPDAAHRLGDLLLVARGAHSLAWGPSGSSALGLHGGLTPEEMLVPLVAWRLDG